MAFQYQILAQQLQAQIRTGELPAGQRLNSLRQFAAQHQVSLNTAKSCYELLEAQGWIYAKHKAGYFVKQHISTTQDPLSQNSHTQVPVPQHVDFASQARKVSNLDLQVEILQAAMAPHLIHLGSIQLSPDIIPVDMIRRSVQRALKHAKPEDFLYSDRQGHPQLREALSAHWAEDGFYISKDDIFICNGCMPALASVIQSLTQVGDSVILPMPSFNGQLLLLASLKRKLVEVPAHTQGIDLVRLEQAMRDSGAKVCLITANFQNPLGYCLSNEDKEKIVKLAQQYQCVIIEDDIYAECSHATARPLPLKAWDVEGDVIYVSSVSKSLSPSYRVGWYTLPVKLQHLKARLLTQNVAVNTPLQLGLADMINSRAYRRYLNQLHLRLQHQVQQYRQAIIRCFQQVDIRLSDPQGGYTLWLQLPAQIDSLEMYRFAQQQRINILPGILFGEDQRYKNYIRLNAGHALTEEIEQAIQCLADWVVSQINVEAIEYQANVV